MFLKNLSFVDKSDDKLVIHYHRSYRRLPGSISLVLLQFCFVVLPLSAIILFFYPWITRSICIMSRTILSPLFFADTIKISEASFINLLGNISYLNLPGRFPTTFFSMGNALFCLAVLILFSFRERTQPTMICLILITLIHLASALFFIFLPSLFPYNATDYSKLYMAQQIGVWLFTPLIMGIGIMPLPSSLTSKCFTMVITSIYGLIFGTLRYIVFLFILSKISLLYITILFFIFGPLIDLIYVVSIYSIHITRLANKLKGDLSLWQW